jgi:hypothetical protein
VESSGPNLRACETFKCFYGCKRSGELRVSDSNRECRMNVAHKCLEMFKKRI